jgi:carboxypeptidase family protein
VHRRRVIPEVLRVARTWALFILCALSLTGRLAAQNDTADLSGTVMDQSGGLVARVQIDLTNSDTALRRRVFTNDDGSFSIPALPPGRYLLRAEEDGYQITQSARFSLSAGDKRTVLVKLNVGNLTNTVTVSASDELLANETGAVTNLTTEREITDLPSVSREYGDQRTQAFALDNPGTTWNRGGWVAVDGGRNLDNTPTVDGMIVTAQVDGGGGTVVQSGMAGTEEVSVQLADSPAEFPRPAEYSTITKGGGNAMRGALFYLYNDKALNGKDYFASSVPFRVYNDGGVSLGGPIKKDSTFYFLDGEHSRESTDIIVYGDVPLAAWRFGNFTGISQRLTNPYTGEAYVNQQLPMSQISPVSQNVQSIYLPRANFGEPDLESGNYRALLKPGLSGETRFDSFDVRLDRIFSLNDHAYASFNFINLPRTSWENGSLPPFGVRRQFRLGRSGQISWTHAFSVSFLNEARGGFTRQKNSIASEYDGSNILQAAGIQGLGVVEIPTVPLISIAGITTAIQVPYFLFDDTSLQWTDNLSWTKGTHSYRFGFTAVRDQNTGFNMNGNAYGAFTFTGVFSGFPYADFLLGLPQTTSITFPVPESHRYGTWWSAYVQDQRKILPRLTLSYGLRWEAQGPYYDKRGLLASFDPGNGSIVVPDSGLALINPLFPKNLPIESASEASYPARTLLEFHKMYFYPRFGFAEQISRTHGIVLRGGYGIYGNSIYGAVNLSGGPFSGSEAFTNRITNGKPLLTLAQPFPTVPDIPTQNILGANPRLRVPYLQQWNLTTDLAVRGYDLSASYIGSKATNLVYSRNLNQPRASTVPFSPSRYIYPLYNSALWTDNGGEEKYNALQVVVRKRLEQGLSLKAGWTWAKDLTDTQDQTSYTGTVIQNTYDRAAEYGNATNVSRHRAFADAIYRLPFGHAKAKSSVDPVGPLLFGGWTIALKMLAETGPYSTPLFSGFDVSNTNTLTNQRPDVVPGVSTRPAGGRSLAQWFNPAAFKIPGCSDTLPFCSDPADVGRFGDARVNTLRDPDYVEFDTRMSKDVQLHEQMRLQWNISAQNLLNHPNFSPPSDLNITSPTAGNITSTYAELNGSTARQISLGMHFVF